MSTMEDYIITNIPHINTTHTHTQTHTYGYNHTQTHTQTYTNNSCVNSGLMKWREALDGSSEADVAKGGSVVNTAHQNGW